MKSAGLSGWLLLVILIVALALLLSPSARRGDRQKNIECWNNVRIIGMLLEKYANDHDMQFPGSSGSAGFDVLRVDTRLDTKFLVCPYADHPLHSATGSLVETQVDYVYQGGLSPTSCPPKPLVWDKYPHPKNGKSCTLLTDGTIVWRP